MASSLTAIVEDRLEEGDAERHVDLCIDVMRCECPRCARAGATAELIASVGGRWDRATKRYAAAAATSRRFHLQAAQLAAGRWFASWMKARRGGEHLLGPAGDPIFSMGLIGGRRGGKSDLSPKLPLQYLVDVPGSIGWLVLPDFPDMPELERALAMLLPQAWYHPRGEPWYDWTLANGSVLEFKSSFAIGTRRDPLKRGRCDVAVIHEAQKQKAKVYDTLWPAIADKGGLVIVVGNPPDHPSGEWVADYVERARSGKTGEILFELDAAMNPHVDHAALRGAAKVMDDRTYRREILGEFLPRTDVVFYAFSPSERFGNVRPTGTGPDGEPLIEVTRTFLARQFGAPADRLHGIDFGKDQHMAAATLRFFEDPTDPAGPPLLWFTDAIVLEQGNEEDLVNALEAQPRGYTGDDICVIDASGEWQDTSRTKGRASADVLRRRGWRRLFLPDAGSKRNPDVSERVSVMNSLFKNAEGERRAFVDPRVVALARAFRLLENRNGAPYKRSDHIHVCDAATYPPHRLFPRRSPSPPATIELVERPRRDDWEREDDE